MKTGKNRKGVTQKRTNCPFTLIYKKGQDISTYQLAKYRNAHSHPLDESNESYGIGDNLSNSVGVKQDESELKRLKKEENTEDFSLSGMNSNENVSAGKSLEGIPDIKDSSGNISNFTGNKNRDVEMKNEN